MAKSELGHYRPWIEELRKEKPYQLEDRLEQLFHEKSVTGARAWNRLFDETMTALRFEVDGEKLSLEPTLNLLLDPDGNKRQRGRPGAGEDVQGQCAAVHADHQHAGQGQGDFRPLARLRGRRRLAPSRQPGREGGGRCAGRRRARGLSAHLASLLRHEGAMARQEDARALGPQRAAARRAEAGDRLGRRAEDRAQAYGDFSPRWPTIAGQFFAKGWIDAPVREGKSPAPFRIRRCRARIPISCSTIRASRAT